MGYYKQLSVKKYKRNISKGQKRTLIIYIVSSRISHIQNVPINFHVLHSVSMFDYFVS